MFASKIFSDPTKDNLEQLYPRDILKYARMFSGDEAIKEIAKTSRVPVAYTRKDYADPIGRFGLMDPINVANGDTIEFSWAWRFPDESIEETVTRLTKEQITKSPAKVVFHATSTGSVYTRTIYG